MHMYQTRCVGCERTSLRFKLIDFLFVIQKCVQLFEFIFTASHECDFNAYTAHDNTKHIKCDETCLFSFRLFLCRCFTILSHSISVYLSCSSHFACKINYNSIRKCVRLSKEISVCTRDCNDGVSFCFIRNF